MGTLHAMTAIFQGRRVTFDPLAETKRKEELNGFIQESAGEVGYTEGDMISPQESIALWPGEDISVDASPDTDRNQ